MYSQEAGVSGTSRCTAKLLCPRHSTLYSQGAGVLGTVPGTGGWNTLVKVCTAQSA